MLVSPTLRDLTDATIAVDINAPAEPLDGAGAQSTTDRGAAGQATPEMLPQSAKPAPAEVQRAGYRKRIAEFVEGLIGKREREAAIAEPGAFDLFARSLDTVQETITRLKLAAEPPDLLITIPRNACAFYEFHRADELIAIGRTRTREALARWHRPARRIESGGRTR